MTMEANNFIAKIKANGSDKDVYDLVQVSEEYKTIVTNLGAKDKGSFSLNVLCIICRNLDKVPTWRDRIDSKVLLALSIDCVRETRTLPRPEQVKTLACIYHIHKHVVKSNSTLPPELMLKLSYMPFEYDSTSLLNEYGKTYWNILADRMIYMERLKTKNSIIKLLPRLIEDVCKVVKIYDTVQFCSSVLTFLVKKLHFLYNNCNGKVLHKCFGDVFKAIQLKAETETFDKLKEKEYLDLFLKFNDCFYVITENASKNLFRDCVLDILVATVITILGHVCEIRKCLNAFYVEGFNRILANITDVQTVESALNQMMTSCVTFDSSCEKSLRIAGPFLMQIMRLFIEYCVANVKNWKESFDVKTQHACLNIMVYLSTKKGEQVLKCDNCKVKSPLHDSMRLLFLIKHFPSVSIGQSMDITPLLPIYYKTVTLQHRILYELRTLGCANHEKCFRKLQTDVHNTAINLNKAGYYDYSIKLFNMYVEFEIRYFKSESDIKNICRALYNKSICELDFKLFDDALNDAFLSLVLSVPDGLSTEKYMSLVMDIKAKQLKDRTGEDDGFQLISSIEACNSLLESKKYGNLKPFLGHMKFSQVLKHEFDMYAKLWPSIVPVAGVWRSIMDLVKNKYSSWLKAEPADKLLNTFYEIVLETPNTVRTIHSDYFFNIVTELLHQFDETPPVNLELKYVHISVLLLKAEYDLTDASQKYGWKVSPTMDPDQIQDVRNLPQEHEAVKRAMEAVAMLNVTVKDGVPVCKTVKNCLRLCEVFVMQLLHLGRVLPALQLAYVSMKIAASVSDKDAYLRSATVILSNAEGASDQVLEQLASEGDLWACVRGDSEDGLVFLCCAAIYYNRCGSTGLAARLLQLVQAKVLGAYDIDPDVNLDIALGWLMEAHVEVCRGTLSAVCSAQRHYLAVPNTESKWIPRRLKALHLKTRIVATSLCSVSLCRSLGLWRRARCACAAAACACAAAARGRLLAKITNAHTAHDAQTRIDNRIKHILGLHPSNETQQRTSTTNTKQLLLTPRLEQLETMLENVVFKKTQTSPSLLCNAVFAYKMPDFFKHENCECYACNNPDTFLLSCITSGLECSTYFRAREMDIARNYFEGTVVTFRYAETKLKAYFNDFRKVYEDFLVNIVERKVFNDFRSIEIEFLIEMAFFELADGGFEKADDLIVRLHDLMQGVVVDAHLRSEVLNLVTTSAQMRRVVKKPVDIGLEIEMEGLKLSAEEPKTPVVKPKNPPKIKKVIVKDEELPAVKRKVIKLNLDDLSEEQEVIKPSRKRTEFKIPVPVTSKPVIESITPRVRTKPDIVVSGPSEEFFTPQSTPDQFFTPVTSVRTYSKKSLRSHIVKNLEAEFSTPKSDKEISTLNTDVERLELPKNSARSTRAKVADKKSLKRATSPGKLVKDAKPVRSRLRNPSNFKEDK